MKLGFLSSSLSIGIIIFGLMVLATPVTFAVSPSTISADLAPQNPSAGENTTITLSSYSSNLDSILISWFVNGKKVASEIGLKSFSVTAPLAGSETTVRAILALPDGSIEKKIIIKPSVLTLLWQAPDSYVPPFYRGKAMPTADNEVKIVAMPEVKSGAGIVNPKNMLYNWKLNYKNDAVSSGYGKNSYNYINDYLENLDNVSVTVSTIDGKNSSYASINVRPSVPQISFYRNDVLLGIIWEQALQDGHRIVGDETIVAAPYFISPKELWSPSLVWNWYLNGNLTNNTLDYRNNWLPIRVEGGISGTSTIGLEVQNNTRLLGGVGRQISVEF